MEQNYDNELKIIEDKHTEMENKFKKILLYREKVSIEQKEKMDIYNKVVQVASRIREENEWKTVNERLYEYFKTRVSDLLNVKKESISKLVGLPFLQEVQKTWDLMKIFIRWNTTLFNPIEKFTQAYKNCSLTQCALNILKEDLIIFYVEPITREIFVQFQKERARDEVDLQ